MNPSDKMKIDAYHGHVPRILRNQMIAKLCELYSDKNENITSSSSPSIERFHGALLFIDISGFTLLSQQLDVDELRIQINSYFQKILDIIDQHNGEVIKFAGDALFILWQTKLTQDYDVQIHKSISSAVACGLEINTKCTNYEVQLSTQDKSNSNSDKNKNVYLNVHAGASIGVMAGIDVGANDRSEYIIMGNPITEVASAEGEAAKGELVISKSAHSILHSVAPKATRVNETRGNNEKSGLTDKSDFTDDEDYLGNKSIIISPRKVLNCGCVITACGNYKVHKHDAPEDPHLLAIETIETCIQDVHKLIQTIDPDNTKGNFQQWISNCLVDDFARHVHEADRINHFSRRELATNRSSTTSMVIDTIASTFSSVDNSQFSPISTPTSSNVRLPTIISRSSKSLSSALFKNSSMNLNNDSSENMTSPLQRFHSQRELSSNVQSSPNTESNINERLGKSASFVRRLRNLSSSDNLIDENKIDELSELQIHEVSSPSAFALRRTPSLRSGKSIVSTELRNVVILFINIEDPAVLELIVDDVPFQTRVQNALNNPDPNICVAANLRHKYNFLERSNEEIINDNLLLNHYQSCMEKLTLSFAANGGQLRQFIVDDKGTVAIGSFGLRGSANTDNAASAILTAQIIVFEMQKMGLNVSIGITSGKAYCGSVGSSNRHEYSIMGPSVNLSARLMCKAQRNEILCCSETRDRDRNHSYVPLGTVTAKGYADPISIFMPIIASSNSRKKLQSDARKRITRKSFCLQGQQSVLALDSINSNSISKKNLDSNKIRLSPQMENMLNKLPTLIHKNFLDKMSASMQMSCFRGRNKEIATILRFIMPSADLSDDLKTFAVSNFLSSQTSRVENIFKFLPSLNDSNLIGNYNNHSKFLIISGSHGIGKTSLLDNICKKLLYLIGLKEVYNFSYFTIKIFPINKSKPFHAWIEIIRQILFDIGKLNPIITNNNDSSQLLASSSTEDINEAHVEVGINYLFSNHSNLSQEYQQLKPLLYSLNVIDMKRFSNDQIETENDITKSMQGIIRLNKTCELLAAIIQLYPIITKKVSVISMYNIHYLDHFSWLLCHRIMSNNNGIVFLSTLLKLNSIMEEDDSNNETDYYNELKTSLLAQSTSSTSHKIEEELLFQIELDCLDVNSTKRLVQDIFSFTLVKSKGDELIDRIVDMSGGHPLYAYELVRAIVDKLENSDPTNGKSPTDRILQLTDGDSVFSSNRIEEVICYRFDQMSSACQLVLKLAAVACSNGTPCSIELLKHMIYEDNYQSIINASPRDNEDNNEIISINNQSMQLDGCLQNIISQILRLDKFLQISAFNQKNHNNSSNNLFTLNRKNQSNSSNNLFSTPSSDMMLPNVTTYSFEFMNSIERNTIYQLMLNDQRMHLHGTIAKYFNNLTGSSSLLLTDIGNILAIDIEITANMKEQAYHFEKSQNWQKSLILYYKSAISFDKLGDKSEYNKCLASALKMYWQLIETAGFYNHHYEQQNSNNNKNNTPVDPLIMVFKEKLNKSKIISPKSSFILSSNENSTGRNPLSSPHGSFIKQIRDGTNSPLLLPTLEQKNSFRKKSLLLPLTSSPSNSIHNKTNQDQLDLKIISPTRPSLRLNNNNNNNNSNPSIKLTKEDLYKIFDGDCDLMDLSFNVLVKSAQYYLVSSGNNINEHNYSMALNLYDQALQLIVISDKNNDHFMSNNNNNNNNSNYHKNIISFGIQNPKSYFPVLSGHYQNGLNMLMKIALLCYENQNLYHLNSLGAISLCFCSTLACTGLIELALQYFRMFVTFENIQKDSSYYKEMTPIYLEWFELTVSFKNFQKLNNNKTNNNDDGNINNNINNNDNDNINNNNNINNNTSFAYTSYHNDILSSISSSKYLTPITGTRPYIHDGLCYSGIGLEYVCASICFVKARIVEPSSSFIIIRQYLQLGLDYINCSIYFTRNKNAFLYTFIHSLILKAQILCMIRRLFGENFDETNIENNNNNNNDNNNNSFVENKKNELMDEIKECLKEAELMSSSHHFHLLSLMVGSCYETRHVDVTYGKKLQLNSLHRLIEINGAEKYDEMMEYLISIIPSVKHLKNDNNYKNNNDDINNNNNTHNNNDNININNNNTDNNTNE
eukprot:gene9835-13229_t